MAVVSMMRVSGDADELLAKLRGRMMSVGERLAPKHGGLGTIIARTDEGILMINLWKTEEGRHAMAEEPEVREALAEADFPEPRFEGFDVLEMRILEDAVTVNA